MRGKLLGLAIVAVNTVHASVPVEVEAILAAGRPVEAFRVQGGGFAPGSWVCEALFTAAPFAGSEGAPILGLLSADAACTGSVQRVVIVAGARDVIAAPDVPDNRFTSGSRFPLVGYVTGSGTPWSVGVWGLGEARSYLRNGDALDVSTSCSVASNIPPRFVVTLSLDSSIIEVGCGAGNFARAIVKVEGDTRDALVMSGTDGDLGPGLGPGVSFDLSAQTSVVERWLSIGGNNSLYLRARLASGETGIWRIGNGNNVPLVQSGRTDALGPGLGALVAFGSIDDTDFVSADIAGNFSFRATLAGSGVTPENRQVLAIKTQPVTSLIARTGDSGVLGPGNGAIFVSLGPMSIGSSVARRAFLAKTTGVPDQNFDSVWIDDEGGRSRVAATGTDGPLGPGMGSGFRFIAFDYAWVAGRDERFAVINAVARGPANVSIGGLWLVGPSMSPQPLLVGGQTVDVDPRPGVSAPFTLRLGGPIVRSSLDTWLMAQRAAPLSGGRVSFLASVTDASNRTAILRVLIDDVLFDAGFEQR